MLDSLHLSHARSSLVRDLSGGERRRLSVGIEALAVNHMSLLALDEPTSGLDATAAAFLCARLKEISQRHAIAVLAVVHQPRQSVFELFDQLLLMDAAGKLVYAGPRADAISWAQSLRFSCPDDVNPSDFLLDVLSLSPPAIPSVRLQPALGTAAEQQQQQQPSSGASWLIRGGWARWMAQLVHCLYLDSLQLLRDRSFVLSPSLICLLAGAIVALAFSSSSLFVPPIPAFYSYACPLSVQSDICTGPLADDLPIFAIFFIFGGSLAAAAGFMATFGKEHDKLTFLKDRETGLLSGSYFLSRALLDVPRLLLFAAVFATAVTVVSGVSGSFGDWFGLTFALFFAVSGLTYMLSVLLPPEIASLLVVLVSLVWTAASGYAISVGDMNVFGDVSYPRWIGEAVYLTSVPLQAFTTEQQGAIVQYLEQQFGYDHGNYGVDIRSAMLCGVVFRSIAFVLLLAIWRQRVGT